MKPKSTNTDSPLDPKDSASRLSVQPVPRSPNCENLLPRTRRSGRGKPFFDLVPNSSGYEVDDCAWDALAGVMPSRRVPDDPGDATSMIIEVFQRITDVDLTAPQSDDGVKVPLFRDEGMSGGFISPRWWNEELLPLLRKRIQKQFLDNRE